MPEVSYLFLIIASVVLGFGTQFWIKHQYKKYSKVPISTGLSGAQAARQMLDANGLANVSIQRVDGELSDHYDPRTNVVSLSSGVYDGRSIAATAVACHECGHALQHARNYVPAAIRSAIVPVVNIASMLWVFVLMAGFLLNWIGLVWVAIWMYAAVLAFQVVTLPVEFNASSRALQSLAGGAWLPDAERSGARSVLTAAALTYVAAALVSVLQLLYLLGTTRR